jgi:hypothetical protein
LNIALPHAGEEILFQPLGFIRRAILVVIAFSGKGHVDIRIGAA